MIVTNHGNDASKPAIYSLKCGSSGFFSELWALLLVYYHVSALGHELNIDYSHSASMPADCFGTFFPSLRLASGNAQVLIEKSAQRQAAVFVKKSPSGFKEFFIEKTVLNTNLVEVFEQSAEKLDLGSSYVALHVRRGDKIKSEAFSRSLNRYLHIAFDGWQGPKVLYVATDDERVARILSEKHPDILVKCNPAMSSAGHDQNVFNAKNEFSKLDDLKCLLFDAYILGYPDLAVFEGS